MCCMRDCEYRALRASQVMCNSQNQIRQVTSGDGTRTLQCFAAFKSTSTPTSLSDSYLKLYSCYWTLNWDPAAVRLVTFMEFLDTLDNTIRQGEWADKTFLVQAISKPYQLPEILVQLTVREKRWRTLMQVLDFGPTMLDVSLPFREGCLPRSFMWIYPALGTTWLLTGKSLSHTLLTITATLLLTLDLHECSQPCEFRKTIHSQVDQELRRRVRHCAKYLTII